MAQVVAHLIGSEEVTGPSPVSSFRERNKRCTKQNENLRSGACTRDQVLILFCIARLRATKWLLAAMSAAFIAFASLRFSLFSLYRAYAR